MSRFIDIFGDYVGMVFERDLVAKGLTLDDVSEALRCGEIAECKMEIPEGRAWGIRRYFGWVNDYLDPVIRVEDYERYYIDGYKYGYYTGICCANKLSLLNQMFFEVTITSKLVFKSLSFECDGFRVNLEPLIGDLNNIFEIMYADIFNRVRRLTDLDISINVLKEDLIRRSVDLNLLKSKLVVDSVVKDLEVLFDVTS